MQPPISRNEFFQEEFYLALQDTLDKFENLLIRGKDKYILIQQSKFLREYEYISDDYSYKSIITTEIKDYWSGSNTWPYLVLFQEESDLINGEIYISDNYLYPDEIKTQEEIDKECEEIDRNAQIEIDNHLNKPKVYIKSGFHGEDSIGSKSIEPNIMYIQQFNEVGFEYDQPYKSHLITSVLHSNVSVHELYKELNTWDLIKLYEAMTIKDKEV